MANKKHIDQSSFEKLCSLQCTKEEICGFLEISDKTLDRWVKETYGQEASFSEVFRQKRAMGKVSLRRSQWKMSEKNVAMAIWLGKQFLGQTDKQDVNQTQKVEINIDSDDSGL